MKKSLLAVVAALAMTGCTQNEMDGIDTNRQESKTPISFNSVVMKNPRAVITSSTFTSFQVYGYTSSEAFTGTTTITADNTLLSNSPFTKVESAWTGKTVYWPLTDFVSFFAYSPVLATGDTYTATTGYPTIAFTVPTDAQTDLVVANAIDKKKADNTVALAFKHALTQVNFKLNLKNDATGNTDQDATFTVTSITLKGIHNTSTFTYNKPVDTAICGAWGTTSGAGEYTYALTTQVTDQKVTVAEATKEITGGTPLLLLPQDFTTNTGATIEIAYTAKVGVSKTFDGTKTFKLTGTWNPGNKILYSVDLGTDATEITFTVEDSLDWDTETGGTTTPSI